MNSQSSDTEKINLIEEGEKIGINEVIKRNEIINISLKSNILNDVVILFKIIKKVLKHH